MTESKLTLREEANALTSAVFRNGFLEDLHAGKSSELLENKNFSRITDPEMKKLMIETSQRLARFLEWRATKPEKYWKEIRFFHENYTKNWVKD